MDLSDLVMENIEEAERVLSGRKVVGTTTEGFKPSNVYVKQNGTAFIAKVVDISNKFYLLDSLTICRSGHNYDIDALTRQAEEIKKYMWEISGEQPLKFESQEQHEQDPKGPSITLMFSDRADRSFYHLISVGQGGISYACYVQGCASKELLGATLLIPKPLLKGMVSEFSRILERPYNGKRRER